MKRWCWLALGLAACGSSAGGGPRFFFDLSGPKPGDMAVGPGCGDGVRNNGESDVDCGGPNCGKCQDGQKCGANGDCESGSCRSGTCQPVMMNPSCTDGQQNNGESDVDCGGPNCDPCSEGRRCGSNADCDTGRCSAGRCAKAASCQDGLQNNGESDVDCGGPNCGPCANGKRCTNGGDCTSGNCSAGRCAAVVMGADTGAACTKATDCAGTKPACITVDGNGKTWPGGYCTSQCNPAQNDQDGLNAACPGDGTCVGNANPGACYAVCTEKGGQLPCRANYSCFFTGDATACLPNSISECDPLKKASCGAGKTCIKVGPDPVGECFPACDPFKQNCAPEMGKTIGCFVSHQTGEGVCLQVSGGGKNGAACMYLNSCDPGFGCHPEGMSAVCRPYCGGANNVACTNGKMCVDFAMTVPKNVVGLCGG